MDIRRLRYLDQVLTDGGFRGAARTLGIAQPTLTVQINQLERDLGLTLLDRTRRPVRPTAAATQIMARVRGVLALVQELEADAARLSQKQTRQLRVGTHQCAASLLPPVLAGFSRQYPNVDVLLREELGRDALRLLLRGALDVCVLALRRDVDRLPSELHAKRLFSFDYVLSMPPAHRLAGRRTIELRELANERIIVSTGPSGTTLKQALASAGVPVHVAFETDDLGVVPSLVARGTGLGFTADYVVRASQPQLCTVGVSDLPTKHDALLTWPRAQGDDATLEMFIRYMCARRWRPSGEHHDQPSISLAQTRAFSQRKQARRTRGEQPRLHSGPWR
jgi:DNA-binding transcriptional LysR family regulator